MKTTVLKENDRVWLEGVKGWFVGDKESSVHAAQAAVMEALDEDISYDYLLGISGLAFRMQVSKNGLCPSSPHSFCGYQCVKRAVQALPYKVEIHEAPVDDLEKVKKARAAVVSSIDRGVPVQYGNEEDGLIIGYQKRGEEWICLHPMREGGKKTFVETNWPWGLAIFSEPKNELPDKHLLAVDTLNQAVEMAKAKEAGEYHLGLAAWAVYIQTLETLQQADEKTVTENIMGNAWIYECLVQYRRGAVLFLRTIADEFAEDVAQHLRTSAGIYEKMANEILTDDKNCVATIAPYGWSLKEGQKWTNEMRSDQLERLRTAYPLECDAIHEIQLALKLIE